MNWYETSRDPLQAISKVEFNPDDCSLSELLNKVASRKFLTDEQYFLLDDGKKARNELVHRIVARRFVFSNADKELFLADIDGLYSRIVKAYCLARDLKKYFAAKLGVSEVGIGEIVRKKQEEAKIEDESIKQLLRNMPDEPAV